MGSQLLNSFLSYNKDWSQRPETRDTLSLTAKSQSPKVLWIGCADSRVPETALCGTKPGDMFVHRNIANCFHPGDPSSSAVLAYAIEQLGIENIVIVGHYGCGGVNAALQAAKDRVSSKYNNSASSSPPSGPSYLTAFKNDEEGAAIITKWLAPLKSMAVAQLREASADSTTDAEASHRKLVRSHVAAQVSNVENSPIVFKAIKEGKNIVVDGWVYDVATGLLEDLKV